MNVLKVFNGVELIIRERLKASQNAMQIGWSPALREIPYCALSSPVLLLIVFYLFEIPVPLTIGCEGSRCHL